MVIRFYMRGNALTVDVSANPFRVRRGLGISCDPKQLRNNRLIVRTTKDSIINSKLSRIESAINKLHTRCLSNDTFMTEELIHSTITRAKNNKWSLWDDLTAYIVYETEQRNNSGKFRPNTIRRYQSLISFLASYSTRKTPLDKINLSWSRKVQAWANDNAYSKNTTHKRLSDVRLFMKASFRAGLHNNTDYQDPGFIPSEIRTDKAYLNKEQINKIASADLPEVDELGRAWFVLACRTGLRYSDVSKLKMSDIVVVQGQDMIRLSTTKTNEPIFIPISKETKSFAEIAATSSYSNNKAGKAIKRICKRVFEDIQVSVSFSKGDRLEHVSLPLHDVISFHSARRSFITNGLMSGIPERLIMDITGLSRSTIDTYYVQHKAQSALAAAKFMN